MISFLGHSRTKYLRQDTRPRQEELAGTATRREQGPGKRSLPGRPLEAQDPGKRSMPGRPTKARQETCRGAPRVPARPGERQAPGRDKTSTAARRLPRQVTTPYLRSSSSTPRVAPGPFKAYVARGCATRGVRWQSNADKPAIVANGSAPDGPFSALSGRRRRAFNALVPRRQG